MRHFTSGMIGGVIGLCAMGLFVPEINGPLALFPASARDALPAPSLHNLNRVAKGDRVSHAAPLSTGGPEIVTTEVLGGVSVVYRDREGRVISRIDQTSNVTYVAKSAEQGKPALRLRANERPPKIGPVDGLPIGCESAVSVTADPELARTPSRCIS